MEPDSDSNTAFHSFVLQLEAGVWDQKRVLDRSRTKNGPQALCRLITKLDKSIAIYNKKTPKLTMTRRKRDLYHLKNKILIDDFRTEKCGLEMMRCDGLSTVINYHINRCHLLDMESRFLQPREMYLNTNVEKYALRLTGYPKTLLDSLHERPENEANRQTARRIWSLQRQFSAIIGGEKFPAKQLQKPTTLLEMLSFLQLGEAIFSRDFNHVEDMSTLLDVFFVCCVEILDELYHWEDNDQDEDLEMEMDLDMGEGRSRGMDTAVDQARIFQDTEKTHSHTRSHGQSHSHSQMDTDADTFLSHISDSSRTDGDKDGNKDRDTPLLPTILCQCMHTLRCVLMLDAGFLHNRHLQAEDILKYNHLLADVLSKWSVEMTAERSQKAHHASASQPFNATHQQPKSSSKSKAAMLRGHVSYFSTLVADTLMCTKCALQLMAHDSDVPSLLLSSGLGPVYTPVIAQLITATEPLAMCSLQEVSNHLTNERRVCKGDMKCMESLYSEAQSGLSFLGAAFAVGWISPPLLELMAVAKKLCSDVPKNLGLQSSWLQTILAGILFINMSTADMESEEEYEARRKQEQIDKMQGKVKTESSDEGAGALKQRLCVLFSSCILDVLKVMEIFLTVSSLQHTGLMIVRLLLRLPYMNKKELELFLEGDQSNQLRNDEDIRAERMMKLKEEHNLNIDDDFEDDDISVEDFFVWKEKNLDEDDTFINDWKGEVCLPIATLLYRVGEHSIQSLEVIEQWLLLVRHLCLSSSLAIMSLADASLEDAIEKVLSIQNDDLYTVALGRICLAELDKLEADTLR